MTQFLMLSLILITTASIQLNAQSMSGFLDLSKQGERGAGQYFVGVGVHPRDHAAFEITQSLEKSKDFYGLEETVCRTEIRLRAGHIAVILTDARNNSKVTLTQPMDLLAYHWGESTSCLPVADIFNRKLLFSAFFYVGSAKLKYMPPRGFDKMLLAMTVTPYGTDLELQPSINADGIPVVENLKAQLASQLTRNNPEGLFYYLSAESRDTVKVLARKYIELK